MSRDVALTESERRCFAVVDDIYPGSDLVAIAEMVADRAFRLGYAAARFDAGLAANGDAS